MSATFVESESRSFDIVLVFIVTPRFNTFLCQVHSVVSKEVSYDHIQQILALDVVFQDDV